ncbi:MAG: hypothetical protein JNK82_34345 [Myxococcaceae bacterium]|nr:hypothetical protein [Myxococcaceae bacterium]
MVRCWPLLLVVACGPVPVTAPVDSGTPPVDAGAVDSGVQDAGALASPDSGSSPDAGPPPPADAGAPRVALRTPCAETFAQVTEATADGGLALGARIACSPDQRLTQVDTYFLSYRTTRGNGQPGASTARVFLPKSPRAAPAPMVVIGHPSVGIADGCAPTREMNGVFSLALPWAEKGYPVIAPDYAGLGNPGTHGYVDNHDTAYSMLDAARALAALLEPGALDGRQVMVGYSEGGGAVLSSQALEKTYGTFGELSAVIAYAPQYNVRLNSFGYVSMFRNPDALTVAQGYTKPVVAALRQYGWYENYVGAGRGGEAFPAASRMGTVDALEQQCIIGLGAFLPSTRTHVRDLIDDELRTTFLACVDGTAGCRDPGKKYYDGLVADLLVNDPGGAPVLIVQGMLDTVMPVGEEAACVVPKLRNDGVNLTLCTDGLAAHNNIYDRNVDLGVQWGEAKLHGTAPPTCTAATLPACP